MQIIKIFPSPHPDPGFVRSQAFLRDAGLFAAIPADAFEAAIEEIANFRGFLSTAKMEEVLAVLVDDREQRSALIRFVVNLTDYRRESQTLPEEAARLVGQAFQSVAKNLSEAEVQTVVDRLPRVLAEQPGVELQAKAEKVATGTGGALVEARLLSDLRPVFNQDRESVEGFVPITTMKVTLDAGFEMKTFEVRLSEDQVLALCDEAGRAKQKLESLKKLLRKHEFAMPDTSMTLPGRHDD